MPLLALAATVLFIVVACIVGLRVRREGENPIIDQGEDWYSQPGSISRAAMRLPMPSVSTLTMTGFLGLRVLIVSCPFCSLGLVSRRNRSLFFFFLFLSLLPRWRCERRLRLLR